MLSNIMLFLCFASIFMMLHEMGHVLAAKIFELKIVKLGINILPIPHVFIVVDSPPQKNVQLIFYFAGFFVTLELFLVLWLTDLLVYQVIYYAACLQLLADSNPFFSDFSLAFPKNYKFSSLWYVHFTLWALLLIFLSYPAASRQADICLI